MNVRQLYARLWRWFWRAVARRGPYRFVLRDWQRLPNIDLATRIFETEYFRYTLQPVTLPVERTGSMLILAPHQDDETIGAGGAMLMAKRHEAQIDVLFLTDGVQRNVASTPQDCASIRDQEAEEACARLGACVHKLRLDNPRPAPTVDDIDALASIINSLQPEVILTPWPLDAPPKHRMANHLLWLAHRRCGLPDCEVWSYQVHNAIYANGIVDITDVADEKRRVLQCYRSQNEHFCRYDHIALGLAAWNARYLPLCAGSEGERFAELFFALPLTDFLDFVERFYLPDLDATYGDDMDIVTGMRKIHDDIVGNR